MLLKCETILPGFDVQNLLNANNANGEDIADTFERMLSESVEYAREKFEAHKDELCELSGKE